MSFLEHFNMFKTLYLQIINKYKRRFYIIMKKLNKKGFTIVELVIVIGVIGILSAILIPTFVNLTSQAQDTQIQSNLRNAYSAYIAEAVDGEIEKDVYVGETAGSRQLVKKIAISNLAEDKVTLKLDDKYYDFASDGTWGAAANNPTALVVTGTYYATNDATAAISNETLSTFNNVVVYAKAA
jgi:type IV pilus assembly protein PilA